jgi:hypothetical protein
MEKNTEVERIETGATKDVKGVVFIMFSAVLEGNEENEA